MSGVGLMRENLLVGTSNVAPDCFRVEKSIGFIGRWAGFLPCALMAAKFLPDALLQSLQLPRKILVRCQKFAELRESTYCVDADFHGARTVRKCDGHDFVRDAAN